MFKLQQERKTMKLDCETAKTEKESLHHKVTELSPKQGVCKEYLP